MKKYGFVYIWYDRKHKRYYIGCRWGNENDSYICSSTWMRNAYKRRPNDFRRRILRRVYTNRKELLEVEHYWLKKIKKEELGNRYYNLCNHHFGHWITSEEKTLSVKEKLDNYWTEENRKKAAESKLGNLNPMKRSEVVEKRRKTFLKNTQKKRKWWTNGEISVFSETCPEGFRRGRDENIKTKQAKKMKGRTAPNKGKPMTDEQRKKLSEYNKNTKWCYCIKTKKIKKILKTDVIPEGFLPGRPHYSKRAIKIKINNITYSSYNEAAIRLNMSPSTIRNRCLSNKEHFSNFIILDNK